MKLLFWYIMVGIDDYIVHPLWSFSHWLAKDSGGTADLKIDQYLYRFCKWSWFNWYRVIKEVENKNKSGH